VAMRSKALMVLDRSNNRIVC